MPTSSDLSAQVPAIAIEGLWKQYLLGGLDAHSRTFYELVSGALQYPLRRLRRLRGKDATQEEFWAIKDLNLRVAPGEIVGIIGANGAGKSTLLKVLSRITSPTRGRIAIRGRVASLLEVGTGFHPELTGRENIFLNGAILGMRRAEIREKFARIVAFAGVERFLDTPVKRYSSGMHVRLAFSVAAHLEPDILLVDEVLAVGDLEFQSKCLGKMEAVSRQEGRTILFVSHDLSAIGRLCRRVVLMEGGEIYAEGSPGEVIDLYTRRATKATTAGATKNGPARTISVSDVAIRNQNRQSTTGMRLGESWVVEIRTKAKVALNNCIFGLGIQDHNGRSIQNTWLAPLDLKVGEYEVSFEAEKFHLAPGSYRLVFGVLHGYETAYQGTVGELVVTDQALEDFPPCITASAPVVNALKTAVIRVD